MYFVGERLLSTSANLCASGTYVQSGGTLSFQLLNSGPTLPLIAHSSPTPDLQLFSLYVKKIHQCAPTLILRGVCWSTLSFWSFWLSSVENLILRAGTFIHSRNFHPRVLLKGFFHLRKLGLGGFGYHKDVQLSWEQIIKLLYGVKRPNLVEFHALRSIDPSQGTIPRLSDYTPKLEQLSWGFYTMMHIVLSHQFVPSVSIAHTLFVLQNVTKD